MTQEKASPVVITQQGTQARRIALTRGELIKILCGFVDFVKAGKAEDFPAWLDGIFGEAERDGAIVFDREGPEGRRFA